MRTERGLDRFVTFLDAVVAIAITLLVLPLVELIHGSDPETPLSRLLTDEAGTFGAFLLSFAVIARLWLAHHRLVERVGGYDREFLLLNLLWILTIVVLPFATQVVAAYPPEGLAVLLYIGTITLSSIALSAVSVLVWRRPSLRREDDETPEPPWAAFATTGLIVAALLLGTLISQVNYWAMLLLLLSGPAERVLRRSQRSR